MIRIVEFNCPYCNKCNSYGAEVKSSETTIRCCDFCCCEFAVLIKFEITTTVETSSFSWQGTSLREIVELVEEYNNFADGKWSDWRDAAEIFDNYEITAYNDKYCSERKARSILNRAIKTNGNSLDEDIPKLIDDTYPDAAVVPDTFLTKYIKK